MAGLSARTTLLLALLAGAVTLFVACGASDDYPGQPISDFDRVATESSLAASATATARLPGSQGSAANLDACTLVTRDEVAAALGKAGADIEASSASKIAGASGSAVCQFIAQGASSAMQLSVIATNTPDASITRLGFSAAKSGFKDAHPEGVSGVGDEAFWLPASKQLHVLAGRTYLILSGDAPVDAMTQLAVTAVGRLQVQPNSARP